ncbi:MAG: hypothetical protein LLF86_06005 [Nitrospiraceae bacterium]|nr:hypothetical protein [Nitrospiraceae bacterium]
MPSCAHCGQSSGDFGTIQHVNVCPTCGDCGGWHCGTQQGGACPLAKKEA